MPTLRESIKTALVRELGNTSPKGTVVSLTGEWGTGKTHLWREVEATLKSASKTVGYVSLFGLAGLAELRSAVLSALVFERWVHAEKDKSKEALSALTNLALGKAPGLFNLLSKHFIGAELFTRNLDLTRLLPDHSVLCLDDLERISSTFPLEDALGYANTLAERRNCRVLVIWNERHLDDRLDPKDAKVIRSYRERVVRAYFHLETSLSEILPHVRAWAPNVREEDALAVVATLEAARCTNVRTLIRSLENVGRLAATSELDPDKGEAALLAALTSEQAMGAVRPEGFYDFHPVALTFEPDRRPSKPDEKRTAQLTFFKTYFEASAADYRFDASLHGLVQNGYLDKQAYLAARDLRTKPPTTPLGRVLWRIAEQDYRFLTDTQAGEWLEEARAVLENADTRPSAQQTNTIYTVAAFVAEVASFVPPDALTTAAENALIYAAQAGDRALTDIMAVATDTRLPANVLKRYRDEVAAWEVRALQETALAAIHGGNVDVCRKLIHSKGHVSAEAFLAPAILQELHATLARNRRLYFETLQSLVYVAEHSQTLKARLADYGEAALNGTPGEFLGTDEVYPPLDNSAACRMRALVSELRPPTPVAAAPVAEVPLV